MAPINGYVLEFALNRWQLCFITLCAWKGFLLLNRLPAIVRGGASGGRFEGENDRFCKLLGYMTHDAQFYRQTDV